jgi:transposase-like protein
MIVVADPEWAEDRLHAEHLSCPTCTGRLRRYGHARTRTVRGLGDTRLTARPRRARCADCRATQVLLPATMTYRRADSTEMIGHALAAKATGAGFRAIAARLGRPATTVRAWLRRARGEHADWLYRQAVQHCARIDRALLVRPANLPTTLGAALNLLRRRGPAPA